jgi:hypothetical protein
MKAFVMKDIDSLAPIEKPVPRTDLTPPTPAISAWVTSSIFHTLYFEVADKKPITF